MAPVTPPTPFLPQGIFNSLHAMGYDSTKESFTSGSDYVYMFVERTGSGDYWEAQWNHDTSTSSTTCPLCRVDSNTYSVVSGGSYNSQDQTISYSSKTYKIRLVRDGNNVVYAQAYVV